MLPVSVGCGWNQDNRPDHELRGCFLNQADTLEGPSTFLTLLYLTQFILELYCQTQNFYSSIKNMHPLRIPQMPFAISKAYVNS